MWQEYVSKAEAMDGGTPLGGMKDYWELLSSYLGEKLLPFLALRMSGCRQAPTCSPFPSPWSCQAQVPYCVVTDTPSSRLDREADAPHVIFQGHTWFRPGVASCFCKTPEHRMISSGIVTQAVSAAMTQHYFVQQKQPQMKKDKHTWLCSQ